MHGSHPGLPVLVQSGSLSIAAYVGARRLPGSRRRADRFATLCGSGLDDELDGSSQLAPALSAAKLRAIDYSAHLIGIFERCRADRSVSQPSPTV
jgi:hypothetical protein